MITETPKEKISNPLWRLFRSLKLTIALLIILALVSIIGTLVPQKESALEFAANMSPGMRQFFASLSLFDLYHSFWFRLLIGLLALNLIVCSIDRFPHTWKKFRASPSPDRSKPFEDLPPGQTVVVNGDLKEVSGRIAQLLQGRFKGLRNKEEGNLHYFSGEKGRYAHFGVYLIHSSILVIIIGALIGSFFGFQAFVNILEGETTGVVRAKTSRAPMDLGFEVRCDKFFVDFYPQGTPKEYRSDITFLLNGEEIEKTSVLVNHPATFNGVTFYQSTYGTVAGEKASVRIARNVGNPPVTRVEAERGNWLPLPGKEGKFKVTEVDANLMGVMGPAVLISVQPNGNAEEARFWIFQNREMLENRFPGMLEHNPKLNASLFEPYTFALENLETRFYTGFQVNRDPGVSLVWLGCFIMVAGFFVTFFTSHRRFWVRLSKEEKGVRISVAGTSTKNPVGLERELERLTEELQKSFRV
jgi:cytochrome c biogenesis protein